jgi:TonB family protein
MSARLAVEPRLNRFAAAAPASREAGLRAYAPVVRPALATGRLPLLRPGLVLSLAAHGAAIALFVWGDLLMLGEKPAPREVITAHIVRKGPKKPENALPVIETSATPVDSGAAQIDTRAAPTPAPVPSTMAPKLDPKAPQQPTTQKREVAQNLLGILDRTKDTRRTGRQREAWGDPNGSVDGNSDTAREGDLYLTMLQEKVRKAWDLPAVIPAQERIRLTARVVLYLTPTGGIRDLQLETPSGNGLFDSSLLQAIRAAAPFGVPPAAFLTIYTQQGVGLNFRPGL